jgi:cysteine-rich repeat protein
MIGWKKTVFFCVAGACLLSCQWGLREIGDGEAEPDVAEIDGHEGADRVDGVEEGPRPDLPDGGDALPEGDCGNGELNAGEECDDGNGTPGDGCEPDCTFSCHGTLDCDDSDPCTADLCEAGGGGMVCRHEGSTGPCDDGLFCTLTDLCDAAGLCTGTGSPCDDALPCTEDTCDETSDTCSNPFNGIGCFIDSACYDSGDHDPADDCRACDPAADPAAWTARPAGSPCAGDGILCSDDTCDGSGRCLSSPSDLNCPPGAPCLPSCAVDASGCVTPPARLLLSCASPVAPADPSACTIDLGSLGGQAPCLSCRTKAGKVVIDSSDFGDAPAACEPDGWSLATGNACTGDVSGCAPSGTTQCCDNFSSMCGFQLGTFLLRSDRGLGCPTAGREEWRIAKTFDTSGLQDIELCFRLADSGATAADGLLVYAGDASHDQQVYCSNGGPQPEVDGILYPVCVSLPPWAGGNPALTLTFIAHSENAWERIYLDDIKLNGWLASCGPTVRTVLSESFTGCGLGAWTVTGTPSCPGTWGCSGASLQASGASWTITRQVDATGLDADVTLCFSYGDGGAFSPSGIQVQFDARGGLGWQSAWSHTGNTGPDRTCRQVCVDLADINPGVNRNSRLLVRFTVTAQPGQTFDLDDITLSGAAYCDGSALVSTGPVSETSPGTYSLSASDLSGSRLDAYVECSWDSPPSPVEGWSRVDFTL